MKYLIFVIAMLLSGATNAALCPEQPQSLVATGNELSVCSNEPLTGLDLKIGDTPLPRINLLVPAGTPVRIIGLNACTGLLSVAGVNEAGAGKWGVAVPTVFPPCDVPRLGDPLP